MQYTVSAPHRTWRCNSFAAAKEQADSVVRNAQPGEERKWSRRNGNTYLHIIDLDSGQPTYGVCIAKLTPSDIRAGRGRRAQWV